MAEIIFPVRPERLKYGHCNILWLRQYGQVVREGHRGAGSLHEARKDRLGNSGIRYRQECEETGNTFIQIASFPLLR